MDTHSAIFITGGARSGKSRFAQQTAEALHQQRVFVATAQALDREMEQRIARHKNERGSTWRTVEAPLHLEHAVREHAPGAGVMLIDCITLWISNLLLGPGAEAVEPAVAGLCHAVSQAPCHIVIVSNEVGGGIVPDNALAREFRDLAGMANQRLAAACSHAYLMAAGLALPLKRNGLPLCPLHE